MNRLMARDFWANAFNRWYFGQDGVSLVLLLVGGTKASQVKDIRRAKEHWRGSKLKAEAECSSIEPKVLQ